MKIRKIEEEEIEMYFSSTIVGKSVFNTYEWQQLYEEVENYIILDKAEKMIGAFNLLKVKKFGLNYFRTLPFTATVCLYFENKSQNSASRLTFEKSIFTLISDFIESLPYALVKLAFPPEFKDFQPFIWRKFKVVPNYTYRLNLDLSMDELYSRMYYKRRNDLTKAVKDNISVSKVNDYDGIKGIVKKTLNRKLLKIDDNLIEKLFFTFANENNSFGFLASKSDEPIAAAFCVYDKQTAYYILGGYDEQNRHHGAGALCIWNAILHAKSLGIKVFDFEGSMIKPVERFFREFGGELVPYYTVSKAKLPIEIGLKFIKREYF